MIHVEGCHGTDEYSARRILVEGFKNEWPKFAELYLAAPNQTYLAHMHGLKNAKRTGSDKYGIIRASIPESRIEELDLGPPALRLWGDEITQIAVTSLSIFNRKGELVEGDDIIITNDAWD